MTDGKLSGKREKFPIIINRFEGRGHRKIGIETLDKLIDLYTEVAESRDSFIEIDGKTKRKKTWQILEELGISGLQIIDHRTEVIVKEYLYRKSEAVPPVDYNCSMWKDSVTILDSILTTRIF